MEKVTVWGSPHNDGAGAVYMEWFLRAEAAETDQTQLEEGWGEDCHFRVETYIGSNVHQAACNNR